jgi:hypothetical protein
MSTPSDPYRADYEAQEAVQKEAQEAQLTEPSGGPSRFDPAHWSTRAKVASLAGLAVVAVAIVLAVMLWPSSMAVQGSYLDTSPLTGGSGCGENTGEQVLILDASGKVLAVTTLRENTKMEQKLEADPSAKQLATESGGLSALGGGTAADIIGYYTFTATVPSGGSTYGVKIGNGRTLWFTGAQMAKGPGVTCS